jgi:rhodanese-related sulfurtransferase
MASQFNFIPNWRLMTMKPVLLALTLVMIAAGVNAQEPTPNPAQATPAFKAHVLTRDELDELIKHPETLLLIDVRRPDELTSIGGFPVYFSVQLKDLESSTAWIPKGRRIVTVSNHAARAGKAADLLKEKGFDVVGAVGAQLYEKDGGKLVKLAPPTTAPGAPGGEH